jgi:drug/metabolite transporter (DMT)-like permease
VIWGLLAGLAAAACFGLAAVAQARAVRSLPERVGGLGSFVRAAVGSPLLMAVVAAYLAGFVLHAVSIWLLPLYLAQASIAMSLPITAIGVGLVGERVGGRQWLALEVVVVGLWLLALSAGDPGEVTVSGPFVVSLVVGAAAIAALTTVVTAPVLLGSLSGLAYAGSAIAVRAVGWPLEPLAVVAAVTVSAFGLLGFWTYSTALDRGQVSAVTAPLIVGQTAGPAVVGVAFLGDGVRHDWWPVMVVGLVLAMVGAALVSGRSPDPANASATATAG